MRVTWLTANSAYVVMFGDSIISIGNRIFYESMKELKNSLRPLGLSVSATRKVVRL